MLYAVMLICYMAIAIVCMSIPKATLPSFALVVYALMPVTYIAPNSIFTILSPAWFVMAWWAMREWREASCRHSAFGADAFSRLASSIIILLIAWLLIKVVWSESMQHALAWSAAFALLVLVPLLTAMDEPTVSRLKSTWVFLGALLTVFGAVEYLLESNPVYGSLYLSGPFPIEQYWNSYRITTSLGHPLWNSLFFAIAAAMGVGKYAETGRYRWLLLGAMSIAGIFLTVSRGGVVAAAIAIVVVALARGVAAPSVRNVDAAPEGQSIGSRRISRMIAISLVGVVGVSAVVQSATYAERSSSSNGIASYDARVDLLSLGFELSRQYRHLGAGAGNSNLAVVDANQTAVVENSYLQLLISLGVPGLLLFLALIILAVVAAFRCGSMAVGGGLIAYAVAIGGFNWLEASRAGLLLFGMLLLMSFSESSRRSRVPSTARDRPGPLTDRSAVRQIVGDSPSPRRF